MTPEWVMSVAPEIILFITTCVVMVVGLSSSAGVRSATPGICGIGLTAAGVTAAFVRQDAAGLFPFLMPYAKGAVCFVGIMLLLLMQGVVDREEDDAVRAGRWAFDPSRTNKAEFYAFFLFSLTGVMLCASARDLVWLFLALELTSLPTYVMVAISGRGRDGQHRSQEAGVKYFYLGALGAAIFLYGFAMIYGGTGHTRFDAIAGSIGENINLITQLGLVLSVIGVSFKIAAVPMHFYTADVYQGASSPVSAFLAFVPKTAGFLAIIHLASLAGWRWLGTESGATGVAGGESLPSMLYLTLWAMAALTMTVGNILALLQNSAKRILAYSSIAHSGYMLVGIIAGPATLFRDSGIAAVLFYLFCYGVMNIGAFAVLSSLERRDPKTGEPDEADPLEDIRGVCRSRPWLGWTFVVSCLGLLGMPPILGFIAKVPLFTSGVRAGEILLVVILGINSAIAAAYYLRMMSAAMLSEPDAKRDRDLRTVNIETRHLAASLSASFVLLFPIVGRSIMAFSERAGLMQEPAGSIADENAQEALDGIVESGDQPESVARGD